MNVNRRNFLLFLGATAGSLASGSWHKNTSKSIALAEPSIIAKTDISFQPIEMPLPLSIESLSIDEQIESYASYEIRDDLVLPAGFTYEVIAAWGDRVGDSRFGYNNDYLSLIETAPGEGYLTVNFEYISGGTWMQTYPLVVGKELPFAELITLAKPPAVDEDPQFTVDAFSLPMKMA